MGDPHHRARIAAEIAWRKPAEALRMIHDSIGNDASSSNSFDTQTTNRSDSDLTFIVPRPSVRSGAGLLLKQATSQAQLAICMRTLSMRNFTLPADVVA